MIGFEQAVAIPQAMRPTFFTLRDAVYGAAVGDALGVPYEFRGRDSFECVGMASGGAHGQPAGTFSDDTSMMLATCDSIRARGRVDVRDMRKRFASWLYEGAYTPDGNVFDVGNTVATACVAGALAGVVYGYRAIPEEWLDELRGKDVIEQCLFPGFEKVRAWPE